MDYKNESLLYRFFLSKYEPSDQILLYIISVFLFRAFFVLYQINNKILVPCFIFFSNFFSLSSDVSGIFLLSILNNICDFFIIFFGSSEAPLLSVCASIGTGILSMTVMLGALIICTIETEKGKKTFSFQKRRLSFSRQKIIVNICMCVFYCFFLFFTMYRRQINIYTCLFAFFSYFGYCFSVFFLDKKTKFKDEEKEREPSPFLFFCCNGKFLNNEKSFWSFFPFFYQIFLFFFSFLLFPCSSSENYIEKKTHEEEQERKLFLIIERIKMFSSSLVFFISVFFLARSHGWFSSLQQTVFYTFALYFVFCLFLFATTSWDRPPSALFFLMFFAMITSIFYLYVLTAEITLCLFFLCRYFSISISYIGLTVLCIGNMFSDFVTNVLIARKGDKGFNMAVASMFSGQIQTGFLSIGLSFFLSCISSGTVFLPQSTPEAWFSLVFLLFVIVLIFFFFFYFHFELRFWHGFFFVFLYFLYLLLLFVFFIVLTKQSSFSS